MGRRPPCASISCARTTAVPLPPHPRSHARASRPLGRVCVAALVLAGAGCANVERAAREEPQRASPGDGGMREQREAEMNRRWQDRPLTHLVAALGKPKLTMNIPGGGNPPGFVVVYGEDGSTGCIDAFAVNSGREPRIRLYFCR